MVWVFLFAAFGSFLIAIGQIFYLKNSKNRVAFFMYLSMAYVLIYYKLLFDFTLPDYGHVYLTANLTGLAAGCLIYFHVRSVCDNAFVFGWKHGAIIFACITIYALPLIPFWVLPAVQKGELARVMLQTGELYGNEPRLWGVSVFKISNAIFGMIATTALGLATWRLIRAIDRDRIWHNFYFYLALNIGVGFIAALIGLYGAYSGSLLLIELIGGVLGATIFGFYLLGQAFPWALYERKNSESIAELSQSKADRRPGSLSAEVRTRLKDEDIKKISSRLDVLLNSEKLFKRSNLSLQSLASSVGCTAHQLSEYLNRFEKKRFTAFINAYRVAEAKNLFASDGKTNNIIVARETGFNSDTHFHFVFQNMVGISPGEYRRRNLQGSVKG